MSLKTFHLVFILVCIGFGVYFSVWCYNDYSLSDSQVSLWMGVGSTLSSMGLVVYLAYFLRKLKNVSYFVFLLAFASTDAMACPVCIGDPNSPMVKSANMAVWFLLGVVSVVLGGFASLFVVWWRRSKKFGGENEERHYKFGPDSHIRLPLDSFRGRKVRV